MIVERSKPGRSQVFDARKLFKNSWTNSISNLFAMNSPSVKQIVAGCGLGKSTVLPAIILNERPELKIITVEPHVKVAKANAKFVNEKWGIKANSIFGGDNISLALSQPPGSILYVTTGKMVSIMTVLEHQNASHFANLVVFSDWHHRDEPIVMAVDKTIKLLKPDRKFHIVFTCRVLPIQ